MYLCPLWLAYKYDSDVIRKHERTRRDKEDDRTRHIMVLRAQTGPVFLTYRATPRIDSLVAEALRSNPPLYDFVANDDIHHTIWRVPNYDPLALATRVCQDHGWKLSETRFNELLLGELQALTLAPARRLLRK